MARTTWQAVSAARRGSLSLRRFRAARLHRRPTCRVLPLPPTMAHRRALRAVPSPVIRPPVRQRLQTHRLRERMHRTLRPPMQKRRMRPRPVIPTFVLPCIVLRHRRRTQCEWPAHCAPTLPAITPSVAPAIVPPSCAQPASRTSTRCGTKSPVRCRMCIAIKGYAPSLPYSPLPTSRFSVSRYSVAIRVTRSATGGISWIAVTP